MNDDDASESSLSLQDFVRSETGWDTTTLNRSEPPVTPSREATEHEHPPTSSAIDLVYKTMIHNYKYMVGLSILYCEQFPNQKL